MTEIKAESLIERRNDIIFNNLDDELVMMSIANGEYYGLDSIGTRIWQLIEIKIDFRKIVTTLCAEYNVSEEQCIADTSEFLFAMFEKKLISIY